jgi:hypothetical protein
MPMNELDAHAKLVDHALHESWWTEALIEHEETAGAVEIHSNRTRWRSDGQADQGVCKSKSPRLTIDTQMWQAKGKRIGVGGVAC